MRRLPRSRMQSACASIEAKAPRLGSAQTSASPGSLRAQCGVVETFISPCAGCGASSSGRARAAWDGAGWAASRRCDLSEARSTLASRAALAACRCDAWATWTGAGSGRAACGMARATARARAIRRARFFASARASWRASSRASARPRASASASRTFWLFAVFFDNFHNCGETFAHIKPLGRDLDHSINILIVSGH